MHWDRQEGGFPPGRIKWKGGPQKGPDRRKDLSGRRAHPCGQGQVRAPPLKLECGTVVGSA